MPIITIAEIGINHNGDISLAKRLIDVAHSAGCDYVKFQKRDIPSVYSKEELAKPRKSPWGETTADQKYGLEFEWFRYDEIDKYCFGKIGWFASPWDRRSIKPLMAYQPKFLKIPSALITDREYLRLCRQRIGNAKIILSTGMSTLDMVDTAIDTLGQENIFCIMHCTSTYPSKPEELNLNCIPMMKEKYPWAKIGFSNHNPGIIYMPIAVALGAEVIEFHITLDRSMYGSDQAASIEPEGVHRLMKYIRGVESAMGDGVKKIYEREVEIIEKLRR